MKALIMAAGRGTRISRHIDGKPKCTLDIGGNVTLIQDTCMKLRKRGIDDVAIVVGYRGDVIRALFPGDEVMFFTNPFYDVTNSIASAWFARDFIAGDDILFMNGDVFFEIALLDKILETTVSPVLFSDETRKEEADYKLYYEHGRLIKYGKDLTGDWITGEYIGIARVNSPLLRVFTQRLEVLISQQKHALWWEDVLYSLSSEMNINVRDVSGLFWAEVDYIEDYNRIMHYRAVARNVRLNSKGQD